MFGPDIAALVCMGPGISDHGVHDAHGVHDVHGVHLLQDQSDAAAVLRWL